MKKTLLCSALLAALMSVAGGAQAALVSQGTGLVYDNVNNLLWFTDGTNRDFDSATSWAAGLTTGGLSAGSWGLSNNIKFSQLAAAAGYVAGDSSTQQAAATNLDNLGINGQMFGFWSTETGYGLQGNNNSGVYPYYDGFTMYVISIGQSFSWAGASLGSLAVASYTAPAPSAVPIPAAAWLMASGLGAFGAAARKRKAQQA